MGRKREREFLLLEKRGSDSDVLYEGSLEEVAEFGARKAGLLDFGDEVGFWGDEDAE